jgi:predicted nucleotidyltransferase
MVSILLAPLAGRLSYTHNAANVCTPSRDTVSTTYSLPYSYTRIRHRLYHCVMMHDKDQDAHLTSRYS